jgi:hypothetical protein
VEATDTSGMCFMTVGCDGLVTSLGSSTSTCPQHQAWMSAGASKPHVLASTLCTGRQTVTGHNPPLPRTHTPRCHQAPTWIMKFLMLRWNFTPS